MSTVKTDLDKVRADAQTLEQRIGAGASKKQAELRVDLQNAAVQAKALASAIKTIADKQRADAKQRLQEASSRFEEAAAQAKDAAKESEEQLQASIRAMLARARVGLLDLSHALAAARSSASKN